MRYQTSSMRKNANPTIAAAGSTKDAGAAAGLSAPRMTFSSAATGATPTPSPLSAANRLAKLRAVSAIKTLIRLANHNVRRVPNTSRRTNVAKKAPVTAPSVFAPYNAARRRRLTSLAVSTARLAAGSVPPMATVGTHSTTVASIRRTTVAPPSPRVTDPPIPM
jgi:hypothetical protein